MIERDGTTTSLWQAKATPYVNQKKQSYRDVYDVIIVGGGITGVTTALKLQRLGMNCLVLEARHRRLASKRRRPDSCRFHT